MSVPTLAAVRQAIAATICNAIPDLEPHRTESGNMTTPAVVVLTPDIDYKRAMAGRSPQLLHFRIHLYMSTSAPIDETAAAISGYADWQGDADTSIATALAEDSTLGGVLAESQSNLVSFRMFTVEEIAANTYFGGEFLLDVAVGP